MSEKERIRNLLRPWLAEKLGAPDLDIVAITAPSGTGFSGGTLLIEARYTEAGILREQGFVIRHQSDSHNLFLDFDVSLQWNMISALAGHSTVPVPQPIAFESDRSVLGAPFFVVSKVRGRPVKWNPNYNQAGWVADLVPVRRKQAWLNGIAAIANIHRINWREDFVFLDIPRRGAPGLDQYLRWAEEWYAFGLRGQSLPVVDAGFDYLHRNKPADAPVNVLWGDATPANMLFDDDLSVTAVLDWEMPNLGPGEVDLAWWLYHDDLLSARFGAARLEGLPDRATSIAHYETILGRKVQNMAYYEVMAAVSRMLILVCSVGRQIDFGNLRANTNAATHSPFANMLAEKIGFPTSDIGVDFAAYIAAVNKQNIAAAET